MHFIIVGNLHLMHRPYQSYEFSSVNEIPIYEYTAAYSGEIF